MKRWLRLSILLPLFGVGAILVAGIGWWTQGKGFGDTVFEAVHVLSAGGDYTDSAKWHGNRWIEVARWLGLTFFVITAAKAFGLLLSRQWAEFIAILTSRDMVLIGNHPMFSSLAKVISVRRAVLWIAPDLFGPVKGPRIVSRDWQVRFIRLFRLKRARAIIVGFAEGDLQALDIARSIASAAPDSEVAVVSNALSALEGLKRVCGAERIRVIAPRNASLRSLHERYPPFLIARSHQHARIHALVVGCGETGEAVIADLLLSSLTIELQRPRITIVDPRGAEILRDWGARAPDLALSIDIAGLDGVCSADPRALPVESLRKVAAETPFTMAYISLPNDAASLTAATAVDSLARREGWELSPIFVRCQDVLEGAASGERCIGRIVPFGGSDQVAEGLGLLGGRPDKAARQLHEAYCTSRPQDALTDPPWEEMPEETREANRRVLIHLPAMLESAGVPLQDWLERRQLADPEATLPPFPDLAGDRRLLLQLAALEHERWMAERRLSGWRWGKIRDDARRVHPDLMHFERLSEASKRRDIQVVQFLESIVKQQ